jgi:hypothetical protein
MKIKYAESGMQIMEFREGKSANPAGKEAFAVVMV